MFGHNWFFSMAVLVAVFAPRALMAVVVAVASRALSNSLQSIRALTCEQNKLAGERHNLLVSTRQNILVFAQHNELVVTRERKWLSLMKNSQHP